MVNYGICCKGLHLVAYTAGALVIALLGAGRLYGSRVAPVVVNYGICCKGLHLVAETAGSLIIAFLITGGLYGDNLAPVVVGLCALTVVNLTAKSTGARVKSLLTELATDYRPVAIDVGAKKKELYP